VATGIVWIVDTSSIVEVRRSVENTKKPQVFEKLTELVNQGRLMFPRQVLGELERVADPAGPDQQYLWAKLNQAPACHNDPSLDSVKACSRWSRASSIQTRTRARRRRTRTCWRRRWI
jgi:hypothetical protein